MVLRLENAAQELLNAAHKFGEPRIDMPHNRRGQRAVNARAYARRAGREHQPCRRPQFLHRIRHDFKPQLSCGILTERPIICRKSSARTIEDGSVDKAIAPVVFRDISCK